MAEFVLSTVLSSRDHSARVHVELDGAPLTQMDAATARDLASNLLQCAEAAESDAMLWGFLRTRIGMDEGKAASIIRDLRSFRGGVPQ